MDDDGEKGGDRPGLNAEVGRRIRFAAERLTPREAEAASGKSYRTLERYFAGHDASAGAVTGLASAAGVSVGWIMSGKGDPLCDSVDREFVAVPMLPEAVSAGGGVLADGNDLAVDRILMFRTDWMRSLGVNPSRAHVLRVRGDSMEPTLGEGDIVLADTGDREVVGGGIFVIVQGGYAQVKRLTRRGDGSVLVISDNRDVYPPETVGPGDGDGFHVVGRVRWYARTLR